MNNKIGNKTSIVLMLAVLASMTIVPAMATNEQSAQHAKVTRSLSSSDVNPEGTLTVTLTPSPAYLFSMPGYQVIETIPAGFTVTSNTAGTASHIGNVWTFTQIGHASFKYKMVAPSRRGIRTISGTFKDQNSNTGIVGGATHIRVGIPTPTPTPVPTVVPDPTPTPVPGPMSYDTDGNGKIDKSEAVHAITDYFGAVISKQLAIEVIVKYFTG